MEQTTLQARAEEFFRAAKEGTLLIVTDSTSRASRAVFSLVVCARTFYSDLRCYGVLSGFLSELGFKNIARRGCKSKDLFICHCAGFYQWFIVQEIINRLKKFGIDPPQDFDKYRERIAIL